MRRRALATDLPRLRFVLLDFHLVPRIDSTACLSFARLRQLAEAEGLTLVLIESAQVTAQIEPPVGPAIRLETMRGGRVVGELGFYLGRKRTAAVVVDTPGVVYRITRDDLHGLQRE